MPNGSDGVIVYNGNEVYQMFKENGAIKLYPLDQNGNAILPQNAVPVPPAPPVVVDQSDLKSPQKSIQAPIVQWEHTLQSIKTRREELNKEKNME